MEVWERSACRYLSCRSGDRVWFRGSPIGSYANVWLLSFLDVLLVWRVMDACRVLLPGSCYCELGVRRRDRDGIRDFPGRAVGS